MFKYATSTSISEKDTQILWSDSLGGDMDANAWWFGTHDSNMICIGKFNINIWEPVLVRGDVD